MSASDPIVVLRGVKRSFDEGSKRREVLAGIDFELDAREMVALVGPSGCGKTTLLSIVGALDTNFEGEATLLSRSLREMSDDDRSTLRAMELGFVFQSFCLLDHLTVAQNVEVPLWLQDGVTDAGARASRALARVGLEGRETESVMQLSGGERQRVAIARAIVNRPKLLLADEPTGNLDPDTGRRIYELFEEIRSADDGCAVLIATHDRALAKSADRIIAIDRGVMSPFEDEAVA